MRQPTRVQYINYFLVDRILHRTISRCHPVIVCGRNVGAMPEKEFNLAPQ